MNQDTIVREHLLSLLKGGNAHMTFAEAVLDFPFSKMNTVFPNGTYTFWHLLEHIRKTQQDILDFIISPHYQEMSWPKDYWPPMNEKATEEKWQKTILQYKKDLAALQKIVKDKKTDLYAKIPHGDGQIILREILLVADHTSYHIGEFAIMRQVMRIWKR
jgi:hypothetical protein